ncbi:MAG: Non-canonical purine NTP pyrophosphatase [Candidatus Pacebacteria bacterium GW2011_GWB1_47_8]|nr:MAG: Non-canonical purine NTP pyrophosphatase [Candidatus Pacebacteria bacterium GW2011_GWA1_46_10]KKU84308.1 MAG: Non-canonical purine NTP pyrophosphatase [Candidatus Pacebacteria bacterium GW2011_GWB1_47_8]
MTRILFATRNGNKLHEVKAILPDVKWLTPADFPVLADFEPPETGETFEANAAIKAREYGDRSQATTVSEDAGLMVDALGGEPGVRSARWIPGSDQDRYQALLDRLGQENNRSARFVAVISWYDPQTKLLRSFRGEMPGVIAWEPQGTNGFGYDPVFIPKGFDQTYAQLGDVIKNQISHRRRALDKLAAWLRSRG